MCEVPKIGEVCRAAVRQSRRGGSGRLWRDGAIAVTGHEVALRFNRFETVEQWVDVPL